ncbi:hypothetical protein B0J11DRAFT_620206 [Dendryphion nanum]|uniref:Uncharacterized protein n=1 Tax=Dendryphion nanum TaxID=256645 RepID=A0A9P9D0A1_9PLEO|nr:hypothetical protein B0J11DRAFT_620206 [Dendryphion nanum]
MIQYRQLSYLVFGFLSWAHVAHTRIQHNVFLGRAANSNVSDSWNSSTSSTELFSTKPSGSGSNTPNIDAHPTSDFSATNLLSTVRSSADLSRTVYLRSTLTSVESPILNLSTPAPTQDAHTSSQFNYNATDTTSQTLTDVSGNKIHSSNVTDSHPQRNTSSTLSNPYHRLTANSTIIHWDNYNASNTTTAPLSTKISNSSVTVTGCPITSYDRDYPVLQRTFTDFCQSVDALDARSGDIFYSYADRCLVSWCTASHTSSVDANKGNYSGYTTVYYSYLDYVTHTLSNGDISYTRTKPTVGSWSALMDEDWVKESGLYSPPCCGKCTVMPQTIEFYFWPDQVTSSVSFPAPQSPVIFVDEVGFTFISPSVYIGFTDLHAKDRCGTVGTVIPRTTIALDLDQVSTLAIYTLGLTTSWSSGDNGKITWSQCDNLSENRYNWTSQLEASRYTRPLNLAHIMQNCSTFSEYHFQSNDPENIKYAEDPCHPYIVVPPEILQAIQPGWNHCDPPVSIYPGFYDPPVTLLHGRDLVPSALPTITPSSARQTVLPTPGASVPTVPLQTERPATIPVLPTGPSQTIEPATETVLPISKDSPVETKISQKLSAVQSPLSDSFSNTFHTTVPPTGIVPDVPIVITVAPIISVSGNHISSQLITLVPVETSGSIILIVGTQTLSVGQGITISGTTSTLPNGETTIIRGTQLFLDPQGTALVVGDSMTFNLLETQDHTTVIKSIPPNVMTFHGGTFTANTAGALIIGTQTLVPGGIITFDNTQLFLDPTGKAVIVGEAKTATITLSPLQTERPNTPIQFEALGIITAEGYAYTIIDRDGTPIIGTHTIRLTPGSATTIEARTTTYSNGEISVVGGITISQVQNSKITLIIVNGKTTTLAQSSMGTTKPSATGIIAAESIARTFTQSWKTDEGDRFRETARETGRTKGDAIRSGGSEEMGMMLLMLGLLYILI